MNLLSAAHFAGRAAGVFLEGSRVRRFVVVPLLCLSMACGAVRKSVIRGDSDTRTSSVTGEGEREIGTVISVKGRRIPVSWFVPRTGALAARGWVLLQHGFARTKHHVRDLAVRLAEQNLLVLTPTLTTQQLNDFQLAQDFADELMDNPPQPEDNVTLPGNFILAGHSIGGRMVSTMAARFSRGVVSGFKGILFLDAVEQRNEIARALEKLQAQGVGVMALLAQPSACNMLSNVTEVLQRFRREHNFVGLRLRGGTHCDAEGASTDTLCTLTCGRSRSENVGVLRDFATHWIVSFITGQVAHEYFPGGAEFERVVTSSATRL